MVKNKIQYLSKAMKVSMADDWFDLASEDHFWMHWRFLILKKYTKYYPSSPNKILEIGCGGGTIMNQFEKELQLIIDGCDLNEFALKKIKNVSGNVSLYNIYDLDERMTDKYETILLLDVIEHIENDREFIKTALKHLKNKGHIVINVPALQSLFSKYDVAAGHVRRYNKANLRALLKSLDLEMVEISYWGLFLLPIAFLRKFILILKTTNIIETGFKSSNKFMNWGFKLLMKLETHLVKRDVIGTSIIAIAKKN